MSGIITYRGNFTLSETPPLDEKVAVITVSHRSQPLSRHSRPVVADLGVSEHRAVNPGSGEVSSIHGLSPCSVTGRHKMPCSAL
jgi:hypothetical protein